MGTSAKKVYKQQNRAVKTKSTYPITQTIPKNFFTANKPQNVKKSQSDLQKKDNLISNSELLHENPNYQENNHQLPFDKTSDQKIDDPCSINTNILPKNLNNKFDNSYVTEQKKSNETINKNDDSSKIFLKNTTKSEINRTTPCFKQRDSAQKHVQQTLESFGIQNELFQKRRYENDKEILGSSVKKMKLTNENVKISVYKKNTATFNNESPCKNSQVANKSLKGKISEFYDSKKKNNLSSTTGDSGNDYKTDFNNQSNMNGSSNEFERHWFSEQMQINPKRSIENKICSLSNPDNANYDQSLKPNENNQKYLQEIDTLHSKNEKLEEIVQNRDNAIKKIHQRLDQSKE